MIVYLDSSVLARAYLADEDGHEAALGLLSDPELATVTGTWTRIEVSGAHEHPAPEGSPRTGQTDALAEGLDASGRAIADVGALILVVNMTPAFPLDGGRVLRSLLWRRSGDMSRATSTVTDVQRAVRSSGPARR